MTTTNFPLLLRRTGLVATALTGYGVSVYFAVQFFSPPESDADKEIQKATSKCTCYTNAPNRIEKFQKIAKVYDDQISRDEFVMGLPLLRRSLLYFNATGDVLEVGAGTGRNLDYYPKKYVKNVVLTDTSDQMLLKAREKVLELKKKNANTWWFGNKNDDNLFKIFVADATNMTKFYQENSFDTIVSTFTLCSFDDPVEVLRELQTICKDNGKILLLEHGRSKSWHGLSNYLDKNAERHAMNWGCVWNRDLDDIIEKAGLEIESMHTWHFGTTYYIVCRPSMKVKEERRKLMEEIRMNAKNKGHSHEVKSKLWGTLIPFPFWRRKES